MLFTYRRHVNLNQSSKITVSLKTCRNQGILHFLLFDGRIRICPNPYRSTVDPGVPKSYGSCGSGHEKLLSTVFTPVTHDRTGLLKSASSPPSLLFLSLYLIIFHSFPLLADLFHLYLPSPPLLIFILSHFLVPPSKFTSVPNHRQAFFGVLQHNLLSKETSEAKPDFDITHKNVFILLNFGFANRPSLGKKFRAVQYSTSFIYLCM